MFRRLAAFALLILAIAPVRAQMAFDKNLPPAPGEDVEIKPGTAESAWIDLRQNKAAYSTTQSAPRWVEAVSLVPGQAADGSPLTTFRIRVRHPVGDYRVIFLRLFFDDKADARPVLVVWDESGTQVLRSGALGSGVNLPTSDSQMIPMNGISTIDIEVPGDGKTVRGVYLDWMTSREVVQPLSAAQRDIVPDPFAATGPLRAPEKDVEQFGTVTATLSAETIAIGQKIEQAAAFQFPLEAQPLVALLTFEVASPRVDAPPEVYVNGHDAGPAAVTLPDLADPGYRGEMEPLIKEMQFQYTGWLRGQKVVPAAMLQPGTNDILIAGSGTKASAIRATQIQLKYLWEKSDYVLRPGP